jgi:hypothetical protein
MGKILTFLDIDEKLAHLIALFGYYTVLNISVCSLDGAPFPKSYEHFLVKLVQDKAFLTIDKTSAKKLTGLVSGTKIDQTKLVVHLAKQIAKIQKDIVKYTKIRASPKSMLKTGKK